jgi:hypothetical protein
LINEMLGFEGVTVSPSGLILSERDHLQNIQQSPAC